MTLALRNRNGTTPAAAERRVGTVTIGAALLQGRVAGPCPGGGR